MKSKIILFSTIFLVSFYSISQVKESNKQAKNKEKIEKRGIDSPGSYVLLGNGLAVGTNRFLSNSGPFSNLNRTCILTRISYEHGWKINFFFEADYNYFEFRQDQKFDFNLNYAGVTDRNSFIGHFF